MPDQHAKAEMTEITETGPRRRQQRRRRVVFGVAAALLIAGGAAAAFLAWDDGPPGHPELAALPFPDPDAFGYEDGAPAMCGGALAELMRERHYLPFGATRDPGITCGYRVPRAYLIEDGAVDLEIEVQLLRGAEARERYRFEASGPNPEGVTRYAYPVGEEGHVTYREDDGATRAAFRSGEDAFVLRLAGTRIDFPQGTDRRPHSAEFMFRELSELVRLLGGKPPLGEPPVVVPATVPYPGLPDLTAPLLPLSGDGEARCSALAPVAAKRSMVLDDEQTIASYGRTRCDYQAEGRPFDHGDPRLLIKADVRDMRMEGREGDGYGDEDQAREHLGGGLQAALRRLHSRSAPGPAEHAGPLYALPYGAPAEFGYVFHAERRWSEGEENAFGHLRAGYVQGPLVVELDVRGSRQGEDGGVYPVAEAELAEVLIEMLEAMDEA